MSTGIRMVHFKSGQFTVGQLHLKNLEKQKPPPLPILRLRPHFLLNLFQQGSCPSAPRTSGALLPTASRTPPSPGPLHVPALGHPWLFLPKYTIVFQYLGCKHHVFTESSHVSFPAWDPELGIPSTRRLTLTWAGGTLPAPRAARLPSPGLSSANSVLPLARPGSVTAHPHIYTHSSSKHQRLCLQTDFHHFSPPLNSDWSQPKFLPDCSKGVWISLHELVLIPGLITQEPSKPTKIKLGS